MHIRKLHSWDVTPEKAKEIQLQLASTISTKNNLASVQLIAGADISAPDKQKRARAAVVVLSYPKLDLVDIKIIEKEMAYPYIPGLLSFREAPLILEAYRSLQNNPNLLFVDGQGIAHPRRMGLASHLGLLLNKPTIGCAKSRLCGTHDTPHKERGAYTYLIDQGEIIGAVLRTKQGVSPLYISIGHMIDLNSAIQWVLNCCKLNRLPEPTRLAHIAVSKHINNL